MHCIYELIEIHGICLHLGSYVRIIQCFTDPFCEAYNRILTHPYFINNCNRKTLLQFCNRCKNIADRQTSEECSCVLRLITAQ